MLGGGKQGRREGEARRTRSSSCEPATLTSHRARHAWIPRSPHVPLLPSSGQFGSFTHHGVRPSQPIRIFAFASSPPLPSSPRGRCARVRHLLEATHDSIIAGDHATQRPEAEGPVTTTSPHVAAGEDGSCSAGKAPYLDEI